MQCQIHFSIQGGNEHQKREQTLPVHQWQRDANAIGMFLEKSAMLRMQHREGTAPPPEQGVCRRTQADRQLRFQTAPEGRHAIRIVKSGLPINVRELWGLWLGRCKLMIKLMPEEQVKKGEKLSNPHDYPSHRMCPLYRLFSSLLTPGLPSQRYRVITSASETPLRSVPVCLHSRMLQQSINALFLWQTKWGWSEKSFRNCKSCKKKKKCHISVYWSEFC